MGEKVSSWFFFLGFYLYDFPSDSIKYLHLNNDRRCNRNELLSQLISLVCNYLTIVRTGRNSKYSAQCGQNTKYRTRDLVSRRKSKSIITE